MSDEKTNKNSLNNETTEEANDEKKDKKEDKKLKIKELNEKQVKKTHPDKSKNKEIIALKKEIKKLRKENKELNDRLLRRLADFENYKKRVVLDQENLVKEKMGKFILELLSIIDNFERALSHTTPEEKKSSLYHGINLTYKQLKEHLRKYEVKEIDTSDRKFDPFYHQALDKEEVDEKLDYPTIAKIYQKGYMFRDTVLRPVLVKVKIKKSKEKNKENDDEKLN